MKKESEFQNEIERVRKGLPKVDSPTPKTDTAIIKAVNESEFYLHDQCRALEKEVIALKKRQKWCLMRDDDCHWYLVPLENKYEFEKWSESGNERVPQYAREIDGYHRLEFENPSILTPNNPMPQEQKNQSLFNCERRIGNILASLASREIHLPEACGEIQAQIDLIKSIAFEDGQNSKSHPPQTTDELARRIANKIVDQYREGIAYEIGNNRDVAVDWITKQISTELRELVAISDASKALIEMAQSTKRNLKYFDRS